MGDNIDKVLDAIANGQKPHTDVLKHLVMNDKRLDTEDRLLDNLKNKNDGIRTTAKIILSQAKKITPAKLLKRLHENPESRADVLDIIETQRDKFPPEMLIKNAVRMDVGDAKRLIRIAQSVAEKTDLSALNIEVGFIRNVDIKLMLIRFLKAVKSPEAAQTICHFLADESKIIVIEALKSLNTVEVSFDPGIIAQYIPQMHEEFAKTAFKILQKNATGETLPQLAELMAGKNDGFRDKIATIVIEHADDESLEAFLVSLDKYDWYGKDLAIKTLLSRGDQTLFMNAQTLTEHKNEFVRNAAEQLAAAHTGSTLDLGALQKSLMHKNWQVRERAIDALGKSENRSALELLKKVVTEYPESSISALKAVARLGFSKGLEVASKCLSMKEASVQREALLTMEAIVSETHAERVRSGIIKILPQLQVVVLDTAQEVVNNLTEKFNLPKLDLDEKRMFDTRLNRTEEHLIPDLVADQNIEATEVVSFQDIEELKNGDYWMERFRVIKEIGRGAMGRVMLVEDETVGEQAILKFMHPELTADSQARERFLRELKFSRKISHPNVIRIHDFLTKDGISAISMEYFESYGLDQLIKSRKLTDHNKILHVFYQVCEGIREAHQKNVIHRDLKPSNILVNEDGVAKVVDFGIASAGSKGSADATLTKTGMIIGTPAYISPERAKGLEADHRADIYALGIIAYAMFTGSPPYKGEPMSLLFQHIEGKAPRLHEVDESISQEVSELVAKLMAVDVNARYQTMEEVCDSIKKLLT
ncbi:MAG: protein kinase [Gammaproteobacteria bacterium]|nr:protein kinase [Gammaproteobacteria bacterium]